MEPGWEELHPQAPSLQPSVAQLPFPEKACSDRGSERGEKAPEGKESGSSSDEDGDSGWKRQRGQGSRPTGSPADAEHKENLEANRPEGPESAYSSCRDEAPRDSGPQRTQGRSQSPGPQLSPVNKQVRSRSPESQRSPVNKQFRSRSPGLQSRPLNKKPRSGSPGPQRTPLHRRPPLPRGLLSAPCCLSQDVYEDVVQALRLQDCNSLSREHFHNVFDSRAHPSGSFTRLLDVHFKSSNNGQVI